MAILTNSLRSILTAWSVRLGIAAGACALVTGCESTPDADQASVTQRVTAHATVQAVDMEQRLVTLETEDGHTVTVRAGEEVRNLPQVEVGDDVRVQYEESIIAELRKPGDPATAPEAAVGLAVADLGEKPAGVLGGHISTTIRIESVDLEKNIVVFTPIGGGLRAVPVKKPEFQEYIKGLKPGDQVNITYREAIAISFEEPAKDE